MKFVKSSGVSIVALLLLCSGFGVQAQTDFATPAAEAEQEVRLPSPPVDASDSTATEAPAAEAASKPSKPEEELVYLNVQDQDIKDVIKQISKATGKNFIIDDKIRGKVTIISEKQMTKEEAYQAFLSALEVAGYTVVSGPAGIIKIVSHKDALSSPIPIHVDSTPYTDSYVTRLISLQNISALEMSNAIKSLISKNGNLFAYPATNTLIITDSGTNIDRLMKIIKELDQEGPQQIIEIVPIRYADAKTVASTVLTLFEENARGGGARTTRGRARGATDLEEVEDVSKIIADDRTNSLIVVASKRAIGKVKGLIARLDRPLDTGAEGRIHVHYLKYANAPEIASTLSSITSGGKVPRTSGKAAAGDQAGAVAQLEGGINIGADETTNALIITASAKDYNLLVEELISKLDIPRRQVYLESMIMELSMTKGSDYGVKGFGGLGFGPLLGFGQTFAATGGLTSIFNQGGLVGGVIGRDTVSIDMPVISGGTVTNQSVQLPAYSAFLSLLKTYSDANIVSSPNLLTLDNEEAEINITSKIYANKVTTIATGITTTEPTPLESGLILKLTPQINEGDAVRLKIEQELSNFTGPPNESGAAPSTKRKVTTTVITNDGQTVVLGGLMQDNVVNTKTKVPILGDIPLLGLLFRTSQSQTAKSNLLIFITPHVIRDPTDFSRVMKRKIEERNRFVDENYGARQRTMIRRTLAMHREDLLEYVPPVNALPPPPPPVGGEASVKPRQPVKPVRPPVATPPSVSSQVPTSQSPVITVPSVDQRRASPQAKAAPLPQPSFPLQEEVRPPEAPKPQQQPDFSPSSPVDIDLAY